MVFFLVAAVVSGCAVRKDVTKNIETTDKLMEQRTHFKSGLEAFSEVKGSYIDAFSTSLAGGHGYLKGKKITLRENGAYLADLGDRIASATGVIVRYSPDLSKRRDIINTTMNVRHSGELAGLLDKIAGYYNINWEYDKANNTVVFYYLKTKTYSVPAYLADLTIETTITNKSDTEDDNASGGGGGSTGENEQTIETDGEYAAWDELLDNVKAMITSDGSVVVSRGSGTITVTESPLILSRIDKYMAELQNKMSRQLSFNIKIYNVRAQDGWNVGASLQGFFNDGYTSMVIGGLPDTAIAGGAFGGFTATVLAPKDKNPDIFHKNWQGSNAVVTALKDKARMTLVSEASGITQNNQPLPLQALSRQSYVASQSTTMSNDQSETSIEPGQIVYGTSILVTPHIQPDDTVNLEYNMTYSTLDGLDTFQTPDGSAAVQLPSTSSRTIMQRFQAKTNSTVVIAGYRQTSAGDNSSGGFLGFGVGSTDDKEYMVIVIDIVDATLPAYRNASPLQYQ